MGLWLDNYDYNNLDYVNMFVGLSSPTAHGHYKAIGQAGAAGKLGHLVVAVIETVPLLGAVASLIETIAAKCIGIGRSASQHSPSSATPSPIKATKAGAAASTDQTVKQDATQKSFFKAVEGLCGEVLEGDSAYKALVDDKYSIEASFEQLPLENRVEVMEVWNELIEAFKSRRYTNKYGHSGATPNLDAGDRVPSYLANMSDGQSNWERKYLSLCGMRNMLLKGPQIADELKKKKFIDGDHHYNAREGLNAFKYYTGTTVDLYTELDDSKFKDDRSAIKEAKRLIVNFGKQCGLNHGSADAVARALPGRNLQFETTHGGRKQVHDVGMSNTDRGNYAIWKRQNPNNGHTNYYVNVPDFQTVIPCILRMPYLVAEMACHDKAQNNGRFSQQFLDDLFEDGVSDMCFNDKIRKLQGFYLTWRSANKIDEEEGGDDLAARIAKGDFGPAIQAKGHDAALAEALDTSKLLEILSDDPDIADHTYDYSASWVEDHIDHFIAYLKSEDLFEKVLYKRIANSEENGYFLLDRKTFEDALRKDLCYGLDI